MKLIILAAALSSLLWWGAAHADTFDGKLPAYGIAGPFPGTLETCVLDADPRKADLAVSDPGTVIVRNNTPGRVKYELVCQ